MNELKIFEKEELTKLKEVCKQTPEDRGYFYLLEYGNRIKIGCSKNPYKRYCTLKREAEAYGNSKLGRIAISSPHTNYSQNEVLLHKVFSEKRVTGTELFNLNFEDAIAGIPDGMQFSENSCSDDEVIKKLMSVLLDEVSEENYVIHEKECSTWNYLDIIFGIPIHTIEISHNYGLEYNEFLEILFELDVFIDDNRADIPSNNYTLTRDYVVIPTIRTHIDGRRSIGCSIRWTQKGHLKLYELLKSKGILPMIERN